MRRIERLFSDYAGYHQTRGNKICHYVGIPLIIVSLLGLLARVVVGPVDLAVPFAVAVLAWYFRLDARLGFLALLASIGLYVTGRALPLGPLIALQAAGWFLQFLGHSRYEGRKPAFFQNVPHLLVGPLWILNDLAQVVPPPGGIVRQ